MMTIKYKEKPVRKEEELPNVPGMKAPVTL
jgi:hypothetical protein